MVDDDDQTERSDSGENRRRVFGSSGINGQIKHVARGSLYRSVRLDNY